MRKLLVVLVICIGNVLNINAVPAVNHNSEFSFSTIYDATTNKFISDLPEMLRILSKHGFRQVGVEIGNYADLCQMMGCDCVRIYTYNKGDIIVKLYIDDIIDPHGEWISTDIIFKSEIRNANFLKEATNMGFRAGVPVEGSVDYTRKLCSFESGARYLGKNDKALPAINIDRCDDDPDRDAQIFILTPEVNAKLSQYDEIDLFSYGLARVSKAGKWGFIDLNGDEIIPCIYDMNVGRFSEGLALVELDYDSEYNASKIMFIDKKGKEIINGHYYLRPTGNSLDASLEGPPVFYNGVCIVCADANWAFPDGNYEDKELVDVIINKKGEILSMDDDDNFLYMDYPTEETELNVYPYGYCSPIENAYKNEKLTGRSYYIGHDTIPGGNGTSLIHHYLVDLDRPHITQLVTEIYGLMDYRGVSTISPAIKSKFDRSVVMYLLHRDRN